jgi:hypothetical protein
MKNLNFLAKIVANSIVLIALAGLAVPIANASELDETRGGNGNPYESVPLSQQTLNEFSRS